MPRNTVAGPVISFFALIIGFALVWHIWWLAGVGAIGVFVSFMARVFNDDIDYYVSAEEVERIERAHQQRVKNSDPYKPSAEVEGRDGKQRYVEVNA